MTLNVLIGLVAVILSLLVVLTRKMTLRHKVLCEKAEETKSLILEIKNFNIVEKNTGEKFRNEILAMLAQLEEYSKNQNSHDKMDDVMLTKLKIDLAKIISLIEK